MVFFQGHPEYEDTSLLKEYRRDVGRFLRGQQPHYPTLPQGYFAPESAGVLEDFRQQALAAPSPDLLQSFPSAALAASVQNTWHAAAVTIYENWLSHIARTRTYIRAPAAAEIV
jgi:homoserine O-succinyltransferase